jgi:hypothetical protein
MAGGSFFGDFLIHEESGMNLGVDVRMVTEATGHGLVHLTDPPVAAHLTGVVDSYAVNDVATPATPRNAKPSTDRAWSSHRP